MNITEPIINAALLGTATKEFTPSGFPEILEENFRLLQEKAEDAEAAFYQIAALTFAYQRAGTEPQSAEETTPISEAPEDRLPYFDRTVGEMLVQMVNERNRYLLLYAYRKAVRCNKLILPFYLRPLISRAYDRNNPDKHEEQSLLSLLAGNRGRWLLPHMELPDWGDTGNETWETASHEERKRMLQRLRKEAPEQGLALLQTELKNESAAHRDELIQCLRINLSKKDEPFLQEIITTDRSSNVKETARRLLCSLPDSELVKTYSEMLRGKLRYKMLLGWSYEKIAFTPDMKKLGLEEVSPNKMEKDDEFLLRQLAERVPLSFWAELYDCSPEKAAAKLAKKPPFSQYFNLRLPIVNFNDNLWAYQTLKEDASEHHFASLIGLLTPEQREEIDFQTTNKNLSALDSWYNEDGKQWGPKFSARVLQRLFQSDYYYPPKETAERLALYLPREVYPQLEKYTQANEADHFAAKFSRSIAEYMRMKEKINTMFNDNK